VWQREVSAEALGQFGEGPPPHERMMSIDTTWRASEVAYRQWGAQRGRCGASLDGGSLGVWRCGSGLCVIADASGGVPRCRLTWHGGCIS
jgi:hypothetical protein